MSHPGEESALPGRRPRRDHPPADAAEPGVRLRAKEFDAARDRRIFPRADGDRTADTRKPSLGEIGRSVGLHGAQPRRVSLRKIDTIYQRPGGVVNPDVDKVRFIPVSGLYPKAFRPARK
jgi:hypothetical protein